MAGVPTFRVWAPLCLILGMGFSVASSRQPQSDWTLVWSDEFNGPARAAPDPSKWTYDLGGGGWGNSELEVYTDLRENSYQDGQGNLVLRVLKTRSGEYTSARLKTWKRFSVQFGRIEARIKLPYGQGIWPAFWMLGTDFDPSDDDNWPDCGEIDVMENIGREAGTVHGTVHGSGYSGDEAIGKPFSLPSGRKFADDYHIFRVDWSLDSIQFFVDGNLYHTVTPSNLPAGAKWAFNHPFFLLLNVAVGGGWPGNPDSTTAFPQLMLVDYVRVYKRKGDPSR
jgi:beta-glucanase (GH16 family)